MSSLPVSTYDNFALPRYLVRTKSNSERTTAQLLTSRDYENYLPSYISRRRWSDRVMEKSPPVFPGYVFRRFDVPLQSPILSAPGVVSILGFGKEPAAIGDSEISAIQTVLRSGFSAEPCSLVNEGQHIRIKQGPIEGLKDILQKKKSQWRLGVSVAMLQRSISVEVDSAAVKGQFNRGIYVLNNNLDQAEPACSPKPPKGVARSRQPSTRNNIRMSIDNRSKMVSFRLTEEEYERFRELCYAKGIPSVSEMARAAISSLLQQSDLADIRLLTSRVGDLEHRLHLLALELKKCQQTFTPSGPQAAIAAAAGHELSR